MGMMSGKLEDFHDDCVTVFLRVGLHFLSMNTSRRGWFAMGVDVNEQIHIVGLLGKMRGKLTLVL